MCDSCSVRKPRFYCGECLSHTICSVGCYDVKHVCQPYYFLIQGKEKKRTREEKTPIEQASENYEMAYSSLQQFEEEGQEQLKKILSIKDFQEKQQALKEFGKRKLTKDKLNNDLEISKNELLNLYNNLSPEDKTKYKTLLPLYKKFTDEGIAFRDLEENNIICFENWSKNIIFCYEIDKLQKFFESYGIKETEPPKTEQDKDPNYNYNEVVINDDGNLLFFFEPYANRQLTKQEIRQVNNKIIGRKKHLLDEIYDTGNEKYITIILDDYENSVKLDLNKLKNFFSKLSARVLARLFKNYKNTIGFDEYLPDSFWSELVYLVENEKVIPNPKERVLEVRTWPNFYFQYYMSELDLSNKNFEYLEIFPDSMNIDDIVNSYIIANEKHQKIPLEPNGVIFMNTDFVRIKPMIYAEIGQETTQGTMEVFTTLNNFSYDDIKYLLEESLIYDIDTYNKIIISHSGECEYYHKLLTINEIIDPVTKEVLVAKRDYETYPFLFEEISQNENFFDNFEKYVVHLILNGNGVDDESIVDGKLLRSEIMKFFYQKEIKFKVDIIEITIKLTPKVENPTNKYIVAIQENGTRQENLSLQNLQENVGYYRKFNLKLFIINKYFESPIMIEYKSIKLNTLYSYLLTLQKIEGFEYEINIIVYLYFFFSTIGLNTSLFPFSFSSNHCSLCSHPYTERVPLFMYRLSFRAHPTEQ